MKRFLITIPVFLLLFFSNSCIGSSSLMVAQVAPSWTPTIMFTAIPAVTEMIDITNFDLEDSNSLAWAMDAQYHLIDVIFLNSPNQFGQTAQLNVNCICMNSTDCCTPYSTFVAIVESLKRSYLKSKIQLQPFVGVTEFKVVCLNHRDHSEIGFISVPWQDVQGYFSNSLRADQLAGHAQYFQPTPIVP